MSAIDWLSDSITAPPPAAAATGPTQSARADEDPIANSATSPSVTVLPLDAATPDRVGLLPSGVTGLPRTLWSGSDAETLATLIAAEQTQTLPAMQDLLRMLLLAEAEPPAESDAPGQLFLSRIDKLLDLGALDPALEMLEAAGPGQPDIFRRYFDVALLTGRETRACRLLSDKPELAPTLSARIFCLAHVGDWPAAALTLNAADALEDVTDEELDLLSRFLDPATYEGLPPLRVPDRVSPLDFRIREGIGEPLPTYDLPRAFAHADLRTITGWKARLEAAERLARVGAIEDGVLLDLYTLQQPAASGGVWDRAEAIQALDSALGGRNDDRVAEALQPAWDAARAARIEVPFARFFGPALAERDLDGAAGALAFRIGLLSNEYEELALDHEPASTEDAFLAAIARGEAPDEVPDMRMADAVATAFTNPPPMERLIEMVGEDRLGEAALRGISLFDVGTAGDAETLTEALGFFRAVGLEETARRGALQVLLLERNW
ncbi:hypothetical protein [Pelagovum pacificum]|nr:hypothetical protein [Pelagovum pacificum]